MLESNDQRVLKSPGKVSHDDMVDIVHGRYQEFDQSRSTAEALAADAQDFKQIEELEKKLKDGKSEKSKKVKKKP